MSEDYLKKPKKEIIELEKKKYFDVYDFYELYKLYEEDDD